MSLSLQVLYPVADGTRFDYDYYLGSHMPLADEKIGEHVRSMVVTRGVSGGPDQPPAYYAVATMIFADQAALDAALAAAGPVLDDIANFTDTAPRMLIGEVVA